MKSTVPEVAFFIIVVGTNVFPLAIHGFITVLFNLSAILDISWYAIMSIGMDDVNVTMPLYKVLFRGSTNWTTWCDSWPTALWVTDFLIWVLDKVVVSCYAEIDIIE